MKEWRCKPLWVRVMDVWIVRDPMDLPPRSPFPLCVRGLHAYKRVHPCTPVTARSEGEDVGVGPSVCPGVCVCARICVRMAVSSRISLPSCARVGAWGAVPAPACVSSRGSTQLGPLGAWKRNGKAERMVRVGVIDVTMEWDVPWDVPACDRKRAV